MSFSEQKLQEKDKECKYIMGSTLPLGKKRFNLKYFSFGLIYTSFNMITICLK